MRIQKYTSLLLILLYGVVGLTGESLHYLAETWFTESHSVANGEPEGGHSHAYFHYHGPDYHGHYHVSQTSSRGHHHHHAHSKHSHRKPEKSAPLKGVVIQRPSPDSHTEHACPLLALVASVRQGLLAVVPLEFDFSPAGNLQFPTLQSNAYLQPKSHFARGPPLPT